MVLASACVVGCDSKRKERILMEMQLTPIVDKSGRILFLISAFEITNVQYAAFIQDKGYRQKKYWDPEGWNFIKEHSIEQPANFFLESMNGPDQPVSGVSWYEANAFCRWLGVRLPTEEEWELATGRDVDNRLYPWGNTLPEPAKANYRWEYHTESIKSHEGGKSPFGIYNMAGNVSEWCSDAGQIKWPTFSSDVIQGLSGPTISCRVLKGGSWTSSPMMLRIRARILAPPDERWHTYGFRVVKNVEE